MVDIRNFYKCDGTKNQWLYNELYSNGDIYKTMSTYMVGMKMGYTELRYNTVDGGFVIDANRIIIRWIE